MKIEELLEKVGSDEEISQWLEFKEDVLVELVFISTKEVDRIRKRCSRRKFGRAGSEWELNDEKFRDEIAKKSIKDWKGEAFKKKDGTMIECTDENKRKLCDAWPEFMAWLLDNISDTYHFFEKDNGQPSTISESGENTF